MPLDYRIDLQQNRVIFSGEGVLSDDDLIACEDVRANPAVTPETSALADLRGVDRVDVTSAGLGAMLTLMQDHTEPDSTTKVAIVTGDDAHVFIARLLEAMADAKGMVARFRSFTDRDIAEQWLGEA